ncbi:MAG: helix-turn-helix domain-containing protein [Gammaproteobacteria bacterium]
MSQKTDQNICLIRLAHPLAFTQFLNKNGSPSDHLLRKAGLPLLADSPALWVPLHTAWKYFELAAQVGGPAIGWETGDFMGNQKLSDKLRTTVEHSPSLYIGLQRLIKLIRIESSHLELGIIEGKDRILLCTQYPFKDWPGYSASQGYQLAVYINLIRQYCGKHWMPEEIGIEHNFVPDSMHKLYPNVPVLCKRSMGYIAIPRDDLPRQPTNISEKKISRLTNFKIPEMSFVDSITSVAESYLADGYLSANRMADLLNISERSLFRNIAKQNTSYQHLIDETRFRVAKRLMQNLDLSLADISRSIGFSDPSNFNRMFSRIGGLTPNQYRSKLNRDLPEIH